MLLVFRWLVHFNSEFLQVLILDSMVDARCDGSVPDASHCEWDAEKVGHRSHRAEPENRTENSQIQATENVRRWRPSASDGQRRATRFWSIAGTFFAVFICLVIFFLLGPLGKHCLLLSLMTSSAWSTKSGIETRIQLLFNYSKDFDQFVNGLGRKPDPLNKFRAINNKL